VRKRDGPAVAFETSPEPDEWENVGKSKLELGAGEDDVIGEEGGIEVSRTEEDGGGEDGGVSSRISMISASGEGINFLRGGGAGEEASR
jgi:hypothetical protein